MMLIFFCNIVLATATTKETTEIALQPFTEILIKGDDSTDFKSQVKNILGELRNLRVPFSSRLLSAFGLWRDWKIGEDLLTKLNELLRFRGTKLTIIKGENTLFDVNTLCVTINPTKKSEVQCLVVSDVSVETEYKIGSSENPICVTLGHEFIHAIHSLEDPQEGNGSYRFNNTLLDESLWPAGKTKAKWQNLEEQRTVLGVYRSGQNPRREDFSEFWLRLACNLYPRYSYQDAANHFMENADHINFVMEYLIGSHWKEAMIAHCSQDSEYAKRYRYTPPLQEALIVDHQTTHVVNAERAKQFKTKRQSRNRAAQ